MGASYGEVVADYLVTYYNYYGIQPGTEKAANIAKYGIVSALQTMFGVEDLSKADLQAEALDYLLEIGLNAEEIGSLLLTLSGLPSSLEGLVIILHSNDVHGNIMGYSQMAALRDAFGDSRCRGHSGRRRRLQPGHNLCQHHEGRRRHRDDERRRLRCGHPWQP